MLKVKNDALPCVCFWAADVPVLLCNKKRKKPVYWAANAVIHNIMCSYVDKHQVEMAKARISYWECERSMCDVRMLESTSELRICTQIVSQAENVTLTWLYACSENDLFLGMWWTAPRRMIHTFPYSNKCVKSWFLCNFACIVVVETLTTSISWLPWNDVIAQMDW